MRGGRSGGGGGGLRNPCLTMHQSWASLLVHVTKCVEGRSWPSPVTGRLWIHAASKDVGGALAARTRSAASSRARVADSGGYFLTRTTSSPTTTRPVCMPAPSSLPPTDEYICGNVSLLTNSSLPCQNSGTELALTIEAHHRIQPGPTPLNHKVKPYAECVNYALATSLILAVCAMVRAKQRKIGGLDSCFIVSSRMKLEEAMLAGSCMHACSSIPALEPI